MATLVNKLLIAVLTVIFVFSLIASVNAAWIPGPFVSKQEQVNRFMTFASQYPDKVSYESIGKTVGGRDILLFKIGNPQGARVMWDAYMHGTEDYGSEMMYELTEWLLTSNSVEANKVLSENYLLFIPVVLMDDNVEIGRYNLHYVNLNRNFKTGWKSLDETVSGILWEDVSGAYAASEPETQALRGAYSKWNPVFYVNLHQGAGPYLNSYGGVDQTLANTVKSRMNSLASQLGVVMPTLGAASYTVGYAIGDAGGEFGANAWLWEVDTGWNHEQADYDRLVSKVLPQFKVALITMASVASEMYPVPTPTPTPSVSVVPSPVPSSDVGVSIPSFGFILSGLTYEQRLGAFALIICSVGYLLFFKNKKRSS